ncbi:MAG: hypothetical protein AUJ37_03480 [Candidatus Magasanikbacteria bacterium CG1_02_41_34]|nr:MAG: hypothetical protein AUJ37_03480 [Candidatus Magasanikbacteria bacterium CG1_02_41_34]
MALGDEKRKVGELRAAVHRLVGHEDALAVVAEHNLQHLVLDLLARQGGVAHVEHLGATVGLDLEEREAVVDAAEQGLIVLTGVHRDLLSLEAVEGDLAVVNLDRAVETDLDVHVAVLDHDALLVRDALVDLDPGLLWIGLEDVRVAPDVALLVDDQHVQIPETVLDEVELGRLDAGAEVPGHVDDHAEAHGVGVGGTIDVVEDLVRLALLDHIAIVEDLVERELALGRVGDVGATVVLTGDEDHLGDVALVELAAIDHAVEDDQRQRSGLQEQTDALGPVPILARDRILLGLDVGQEMQVNVQGFYLSQSSKSRNATPKSTEKPT